MLRAFKERGCRVLGVEPAGGDRTGRFAIATDARVAEDLPLDRLAGRAPVGGELHQRGLAACGGIRQARLQQRRVLQRLERGRGGGRRGR